MIRLEPDMSDFKGIVFIYQVMKSRAEKPPTTSNRYRSAMASQFTQASGKYEIVRHEHLGVTIVYLRDTTTGSLQSMKVLTKDKNPFIHRPLTRSESLVHNPNLPKHPKREYKGELHTCTFSPSINTSAFEFKRLPNTPFIERVEEDIMFRQIKSMSPERLGIVRLFRIDTPSV
jgi:hypothetical protein